MDSYLPEQHPDEAPELPEYSYSLSGATFNRLTWLAGSLTSVPAGFLIKLLGNLLAAVLASRLMGVSRHLKGDVIDALQNYSLGRNTFCTWLSRRLWAG